MPSGVEGTLPVVPLMTVSGARVVESTIGCSTSAMVIAEEKLVLLKVMCNSAKVFTI